ncbi:sn-glycerol-3-phosphate ABC transporter ATP-binding protein UgpC [Azospirillum sp. TSO35-2]|uniref:ABC transporter ATP-binding protein n=1 Tax=Azospirillum sp. TSO35-2 TaxID=716796 RepID=UPI000D60A2C5|nr:sn-glycerol-3-phosphate ABC transporter ATP-binding protein UgpC [Azospirillum sp. TSO35-2]PWC33375.1 sugar ABC transporter ATPase [Azospirillum sp. TSO35-2]
MATLSINNVRKQYGSVEVLKGIDLSLSDGEFLVLLGPSGCGKSTLLNMIAGLETISAGEIRIDQRVINGVHPKDRDIAMVFQSYALYPNMTVARNIGFSLEMRGQSKPDRETAIRRVAKLLQIEHLLDRKPAQLSGGQRQRVAMGRALVRDPKVFLFDEPLSNLDAKLRVDMRTEIKKLHQRLGTTVVYVTHDQIEAMTLASRIAIMKEGVVQQFAPPQEVYERPANMYVASFIGSPTMNFVRGTLSAEGDRLGIALRRDGGGPGRFLPLHEAPADAGRWLGRDVILGIRPEAITCHDPSVAAGNPALVKVDCRVNVLEPTGADTITYIEMSGQEVVARIKPSDMPVEGQSADFMIDMARANLFDPQTEQRI